jgi:hypothetical protein
MTPPPTQTLALPLDPGTLATMQSAIMDGLPPRPGAAEAEKAVQREGALALLAALCPGDPVQAMLAVHIVASHYAAVDCFRSAARDGLSVDLHLRTIGKAVALCRMIERSMRDLAQRQGIPVVRPAAVRPAAVLAASAQPAPEAVRVEAPAQPPVAKNRHERRSRKHAVRHLAAAAQRAGLGTGALVNAMQERLRAEVAARAAADAVAVAV